MAKNGTVGFIGLGAMGYGMARNLVEKGHDVLAYDLKSQPLQKLIQQGGRQAESVAEIGRSCQQVMVMVVDGEQISIDIDGVASALNDANSVGITD